MSLSFYFDHHIPAAITQGLRLRGADVVTAFEDGAHTLSDDLLLDRATELGRVLFSMDVDLPIEAVRRQRLGIHFAGLLFAQQRNCPIGTCLQDLQLLAEAAGPEDLAGQIVYLPL